MAKRTNPSGNDPDAYFISLQNAVKTTANAAGVPEAAKWTSEAMLQIIPLIETARDIDIQKDIILQEWAMKILHEEKSLINISDMADRLKDIRKDILANHAGALQKMALDRSTTLVHYLYQKAAQKTLPVFQESTGQFSLLAGAVGKDTEQKEINMDMPEIKDLINWSPVVWRNPYFVGPPGSGKTNSPVLLTSWAVYQHQGTIFDQEMAINYMKKGKVPDSPAWYRKQGIIRGTLRVYFPNMQFPIEEPKDKRISDLKVYAHSYAYRHAWEIYLDDPPGSSVLWIKHDQTMNKRLNLGIRPESIYALVYMGEMGKGRKMESGTSKNVTAMMVNFQLSRQIGVRFFMSGATMPAAQIMDAVNPVIEMISTPTGKRDILGRPKLKYTAVARYLDPNGKGEVRRDLGMVPLHPLTELLNENISSDMSAEFGELPLKEIFDQSQVTNPIVYDKDPESVIREVDQIIREMYDISSRNEYPNGEKVKQTVKVVQKTNHDDEPDEIFM